MPRHCAKCTTHPTVNYCECVCWPHEAQCTDCIYTSDVEEGISPDIIECTEVLEQSPLQSTTNIPKSSSPSPPLNTDPLEEVFLRNNDDTMGNTERLADNNNSNGRNNSNTPKNNNSRTSTPTRQRGRSMDRTSKKQNNQPNSRISSPKLSRTTENNFFQYPDIGTREHRYHIDMHNKCIKLQRKAMDNNEYTEERTNRPRYNLTDAPRKKQRQSTIPIRPNESTRGTSNTNNERHRKRRISRSPIPKCKRFLFGEEETNIPNTPRSIPDQSIETRSNSEENCGQKLLSDKEENTTDSESEHEQETKDNTQFPDPYNIERKHFVTFVIHKEHIGPNRGTVGRDRNQQPSFAEFDHGDHIHVIFTTTNPNTNVARTRSRICKFLDVSIGGCTEALTTTTRVYSPRKFILYCLKYGATTFSYFGTGIKGLDSYIDQLHKITKINKIIPHTKCLQFIEEKRKQRSEDQAFHTSQSRLARTIRDLVYSSDCLYYKQFTNSLKETVKLHLLEEFGTSWTSYAKSTIEIKRESLYKNIKSTEYLDWTIDKIKPHIDAEIFEWLEFWFNKQKINKIDFYAWFLIVKNQMTQKINTFVLRGITNSGKSMMLRALLLHCLPEHLTREKDKNSFHLQNLPCATSVLYEEPQIDQSNVNTMKLLLEGTQTMTDVKHSDKEPIPRIPIFITTNPPIETWIPTEDKAAMKTRYIEFQLYYPINHSSDKTFNVKPITGPPKLITSGHIFAHLLIHYKQIQQRITCLLKEKVLAQELVHPSKKLQVEELAEQLEAAWEVQLAEQLEDL